MGDGDDDSGGYSYLEGASAADVDYSVADVVCEYDVGVDP